MKIIDLLNKIAKGEEVPKKIKLDNYVFEFNKTYEQYHNKYETNLLEHISDYNYSGLNDEVEIIEGNEEIEELNVEQDGNTYYIKNEYGRKCYLTKHSYLIADKVDELVREINKLKGKNKYE